MSKRRMPDIVSERNRLDQILIEAQCLCDRSGILRYLKCMGQSRPVMIALRRQKHLRFVLETPERLAVQDAVSVTLKYRSDITRLLIHISALRMNAERGVRT